MTAESERAWTSALCAIRLVVGHDGMATKKESSPMNDAAGRNTKASLVAYSRHSVSCSSSY